MKKISDRTFGKIFLVVGALALAAILLLTAFAAKNLGADYRNLKDAELSQGFKGSLTYNDHLYAQLGYMTEILPEDEGKEQALEKFVSSSLQAIDRRILTAGVTYTMLLCAAAAYPVYVKFGQNRKKHVCAAVLSAALPFAAYILFAAALQLVFGVPLYFTDRTSVLPLLVSLLAVAGGSSALALLLKAVRHKRIIAVLAIPVVFALFLIGANMEAQLYSPPTVDSFDYVFERDERMTDPAFMDRCYYDEEKNALIVDGKEYPPEQAANPDRFTGGKRIGAYIFELISPYAGNALLLAQDVGGFTVPPLVLLLYVCKALFCISLPLWVRKKNH